MSRKKVKIRRIRQRNFVQAHVQQCCRPQVFDSELDKQRRGYIKHKKAFVTDPGEWDFKLCAA